MDNQQMEDLAKSFLAEFKTFTENTLGVVGLNGDQDFAEWPELLPGGWNNQFPSLEALENALR